MRVSVGCAGEGVRGMAGGWEGGGGLLTVDFLWMRKEGCGGRKVVVEGRLWWKEGEGEGGKRKERRGAVLWWIRARELATKRSVRRREFYHWG